MIDDSQASVQIGTAVHSDIAETVLDGVTSESASSLSSSGYGSQVFSAKSEESILGTLERSMASDCLKGDQ